MKAKTWFGVAAVAAVAALGACSSGGGGGGALSTAQFIDSPVKGLSYKGSSGSSGVTGAEGKFSCQRGEVITFSLKGLNLGYAACGDKIFVQDLTSYATNYHWQKVAALIQTLSTSSGGDLDLSGATASTLDLSNFNFGADAGAFTTNLTNAHAAANITGTAVVDQGAASTHANSSIATYIELPENFETALDEAISNGPVYLMATRTSGDAENCWKHYAAKTEVTKVGDAYWFNMVGAAGFNDEQHVDTNGCKALTDPETECEDVEVGQLPRPKIIAGTSMDLVFSNNIQVDLGGGAVDAEARSRLSLNATMAGEDMNLTGTFDHYTKVLEGQFAGQSVSCAYSVVVAP